MIRLTSCTPFRYCVPIPWSLFTGNTIATSAALASTIANFLLAPRRLLTGDTDVP